MPSDPLILGFDTSAAHCAAVLLSGDRILASRTETMTRGQAERLMPLLQDLLDDAAVAWCDLAAIGVGIGPGNFTGIRIAVSAARGLALGLGIPAVGVSGCEARTALAGKDCQPAIPAPRDMVYLCGDGDLPELLDRHEAAGRAAQIGLTLWDEPCPDGLAVAIARLAQERWPDTHSPPAPVYIRPADAAPPSEAPPVLLD